MAKFKFHSAIEDILIEYYDYSEAEAESAVQKAADSGDFDLNSDNLDTVVEHIYSEQKYW